MAGEELSSRTVAIIEKPHWPASSVLDRATFAHLQVVVLLLAVFLTCGLTPMQGDTWWQLRAGKDMWMSGRVLLTDIYSHTVPGAFWSNHEWLAEVVFYALYRLGGLPLLTLFAAALITGGWVFTWRMTRGDASIAFLLMLLALTSSAGWWEPRPHAFSLFFVPFTVFLLHRGALGWLPAVFLLWANTHGGVLLGFVLLAAGLTGRTLVEPSRWRESLLYLLLGAAAITLTPLGTGFWIEIPRSLSRISGYTLDEWSRTELTDPTMLSFWGIAACYIWAVAGHLRRLRMVTGSDAAVHACALTLLPFAIGAVRNVGLFLMIAVPALTYLWAADSKPAKAAPEPDRRYAALNAAIMVLACAGVAATLTVAYSRPWTRLRWNPMPAAAIAALNGCPDNLYNRYDEGGMLLWFAPGRKVFLDGRQDPFPPALVAEHIEMETGRRPYGPTFARHGIRCAFLPAVSPVAAQLAEDGWTTLHRDASWVVLRER